jgi:hypothetical protein
MKTTKQLIQDTRTNQEQFKKSGQAWQKETENEKGKSKTERIADHLWIKMGELYANKWTIKNGDHPSDLWLGALNMLTRDQIQAGIDQSIKNIYGGNSWSPDLAEFMAGVYGQTESIEQVYKKIIYRKYTNAVDLYLAQRIGYTLRQQSIAQGTKALRGHLDDARELERAGKLPPFNQQRVEIMGKTPKSNPTDQQREDLKAYHASMHLKYIGGLKKLVGI